MAQPPTRDPRAAQPFSHLIQGPCPTAQARTLEGPGEGAQRTSGGGPQERGPGQSWGDHLVQLSPHFFPGSVSFLRSLEQSSTN